MFANTSWDVRAFGECVDTDARGTGAYRIRMPLLQSALFSDEKSKDTCTQAAFCCLFFGRHSRLLAIRRPLLEVQPEIGWKTITVFVGTRQAESHQKSWKSFSQVHQDDVIRAMFPDGGHYFIDLAANDWRKLSNSYSLETYDGWSGLCIEPNDLYWKAHFQRRCLLVGAAVGGKGEFVQFRKSDGVFGGIIGERYDITKMIELLKRCIQRAWMKY